MKQAQLEAIEVEERKQVILDSTSECFELKSMITELLQNMNQLTDLKQVCFDVDIDSEALITVYGDRRRIKNVIGSFMKLALSKVETNSQI